MKQFALCLALCLSLLLAACATAPEGSGSIPPASRSGVTAPASGEPQPAKLLCRVIDGGEEGTLLLAEQGDGLYGGQGIYTLPLSACTITADGAATDPVDLAPQSGTLAEVGFDGTVAETYPAQFGGGVTLNLLSQGANDLCRLYLDVLEDLWEVDSGLNEQLVELGVDLSQTSLTPSEQSAVAWVFGQRHGLTAIQGTWEELVDQGHISATPLGDGAPENAAFYEWKDGIFFSITEKEGEGASSQSGLTFDAQKWRTSLGAYFFGDCSAKRSADGQWGEYTIGSQAIS